MELLRTEPKLRAKPTQNNFLLEQTAPWASQKTNSFNFTESSRSTQRNFSEIYCSAKLNADEIPNRPLIKRTKRGECTPRNRCTRSTDSNNCHGHVVPPRRGVMWTNNARAKTRRKSNKRSCRSRHSVRRKPYERQSIAQLVSPCRETGKGISLSS